MKKNYLLILLIFLFGCSNVTNQHSNQISEKVLDSLMTASKEIPLTKYQSQDSQIKTAPVSPCLVLVCNEDASKTNISNVLKAAGFFNKRDDKFRPRYKRGRGSNQ